MCVCVCVCVCEVFQNIYKDYNNNNKINNNNNNNNTRSSDYQQQQKGNATDAMKYWKVELTTGVQTLAEVGLISWGHRIHRLHLCRVVRLPQRVS